MAAALTGMGLFKIAGYALNGFDYRPFLAMILLAVVAAFIGTWVGKLIHDRVSERVFRFVFRAAYGQFVDIRSAPAANTEYGDSGQLRGGFP
jgi:uncharacterized membrane protein YfcA